MISNSGSRLARGQLRRRAPRKLLVQNVLRLSIGELAHSHQNLPSYVLDLLAFIDAAHQVHDKRRGAGTDVGDQTRRLHRHSGAARRVQVYRNNVRTNLTGALKSIYPVVEKLVGDGFFNYTAAEYIKHDEAKASRFAGCAAGLNWDTHSD